MAHNGATYFGAAPNEATIIMGYSLVNAGHLPMVEQRFPTGAVFPQIPATGPSQQIQQVDVFELACIVNAGSRIDRLDSIVSLGTASGEVAAIWAAYGENVDFFIKRNMHFVMFWVGSSCSPAWQLCFLFNPSNCCVARCLSHLSLGTFQNFNDVLVCCLFHRLFSCGLYGCVFSACEHVTLEHAVKHLSSPL